MWLRSWVNVHVMLFGSVHNALDRINNALFMSLTRFIEWRKQSKETVLEAIARGDVRKVHRLVENGACLSPTGHTALHAAIEKMADIMEEEEEQDEDNNVADETSFADSAAMSAPTIVMPEIAFEPDINGVCNWEGTFEISSKPRKMANTNVNNNRISMRCPL